MSKKKNTLKDLDEFLNQQAARLVTPTQLSEIIQEPEKPRQHEVQKDSLPPLGSPEKMLESLKHLATDRNKLYDLIVKSVESQDPASPEDKMLINTALYLKSGKNWKEVIRNYWKSR